MKGACSAVVLGGGLTFYSKWLKPSCKTRGETKPGEWKPLDSNQRGKYQTESDCLVNSAWEKKTSTLMLLFYNTNAIIKNW